MGGRSGRAHQGAGMLGSASDGITGYASAADVEVIFMGYKPCKSEKISKSDADLRVATAKLIRSVWIVTPARRDVDITLVDQH